MKRLQAYNVVLASTSADEFKITFLDNPLGFEALAALESYNFFVFDPDNKGNDERIRVAIKWTVKQKNWEYSGREIVCYPRDFMSRGSDALNNFLTFVAYGIEDLQLTIKK